MIDISQRLRMLRKEKGLQQKDLAAILGIGRQSMSHYETNKRMPDYETLNKIADYFGVTTDYLLGRSELRSGRLVTEEELYKHLPENIVAKIKHDKLKIIVDDSDLDPRTIDEIIDVLKKNKYM